MNNVILMGRLTADPEIRHTANNEHSIASFTLAVDRRVAKGEQKADFIRCQGWDKKAEFAEKYLRKGTKVLIGGRIQTGSYKDKDDKTVYTTDVVIEEIEFAESKKSDGAAPDPEPKTSEWLDVPDNIAEQLPFN